MIERTKTLFRPLTSFCVCACLAAGVALFAQEADPATSHAASVLDSMPHAKRIGEVSLSPDGRQVAYIVDGELSLISAAGGDSRAIALESKLPLREVSWSADSKRIAFIADLPGEVPAAQVWMAVADTGALTKLAELKGYVQTPRFSPDGTKLAILFIEGMPRVAGPLQPMTPLSGVIDEQIFEQRIATIDLNSANSNSPRIAQVTPADMYVYEYDWTPDGKGWAAIAAHGSGDANWWVARLYLANAQSGQMREIYKPKLQLAEPHVSPDGKNVAFIEGLDE